MRIDRCVCRAVTFATLREESARSGCRTVACLQGHRDFGTGCGLCLPYVERMLETGETVFHRILTGEDVTTAR